MATSLKARSADVVGVENVSLGERLRALRELKAMTQKGLEATSGVRQGDISAIECGKKAMGLAVARKLATGLDVPLPMLLERSSDGTGGFAVTSRQPAA